MQTDRAAAVAHAQIGKFPLFYYQKKTFLQRSMPFIYHPLDILVLIIASLQPECNECAGPLYQYTYQSNKIKLRPYRFIFVCVLAIHSLQGKNYSPCNAATTSSNFMPLDAFTRTRVVPSTCCSSSFISSFLFVKANIFSFANTFSAPLAIFSPN